jgi:uncharacterized protein YqhQ
MAKEKIRLGGMALANGVLVHGPKAWACAIRTDDGELKVAARLKRLRSTKINSPLLRGPVRLLDALAILPEIRRALPEARLPFQRPAVLASMLASATVVRLVRGSRSVGPGAQELLSGLLSLAPAAMALRSSDVAAYHGAEHISIGSYEQGKPAAKEHDRCGSHLVAPLMVANVAGVALLHRLVERPSKAAGLAVSVGATSAAVEVFAWAERHRGSRLERLLNRPGHELQRAIGTREPTEEQLEVGRTALDEILRAERSA